jgi:hypothetical protein
MNLQPWCTLKLVQKIIHESKQINSIHSSSKQKTKISKQHTIIDKSNGGIYQLKEHLIK